MPEDKDLQERQGVDAEKPEDGSSADIDDILSEIEIEDPESSPGQDSSSQLQEEPQHEASESGEVVEIEEEGEKEAPAEDKEEGSGLPDDTPGDKALEDAFDSALSEDELWDESGDLEDIPLFQELEKQEEAQEGAGGKAETAAPLQQDAGESSEAVAGDEPPPEEFRRTARADDAITVVIPDNYFPYAAGGAALLILAAIFVIWNLASTPPPRPVAIQPAPIQGAGLQKAKTRGTGEQPARSKQVETLALAPFLIPAERSGELVFFKLEAELIVDSQTTKHELMRKEAWVRDIIYSELKGIDISNGVAGNVLLRYRKPIVDRINRELAPLRVDDIRMVGVLLK